MYPCFRGHERLENGKSSVSRVVIKEGFLGETGQRGSNSHRSLNAQMRNPDPEATGSFICAPSPGQGCLTPPRVGLRAVTPVGGLRGRQTWAQGPIHTSSKAMDCAPTQRNPPWSAHHRGLASGLVSAMWPGRLPDTLTACRPGLVHILGWLLASKWLRDGRQGSPPRMPGDESCPIPIYFLSVMLLKSPTRSANMEGAQGSGGEGK